MPQTPTPRPNRAVAIAFLAALLLTAWPHQVSAQKPAAAATPSLPDVLAKAAEYCRKLESSAFDFVCREEIRETIDPKYDAAAKGNPRDAGSTNYLGPGAANFSGPTIVISSV